MMTEVNDVEGVEGGDTQQRSAERRSAVNARRSEAGKGRQRGREREEKEKCQMCDKIGHTAKECEQTKKCRLCEGEHALTSYPMWLRCLAMTPSKTGSNPAPPTKEENKPDEHRPPFMDKTRWQAMNACSSCKSYGHTTKNCPNRKCYICHQTGHVARTCPRAGGVRD